MQITIASVESVWKQYAGTYPFAFEFLSDVFERQYQFDQQVGKLFTYLDHDDCPWNNNNAEHAIIPFAKYRTYRDSHFTKKTITEYLALLSIQQTCIYRGVKFLDFLRSGTESIEDFCK